MRAVTRDWAFFGEACRCFPSWEHFIWLVVSKHFKDFKQHQKETHLDLRSLSLGRSSQVFERMLVHHQAMVCCHWRCFIARWLKRPSKPRPRIDWQDVKSADLPWAKAGMWNCSSNGMKRQIERCWLELDQEDICSRERTLETFPVV